MRSLDPDLTVGDIVGEGLRISDRLSAAEITAQVEDALAQVGLGAALLPRQPGQISGGQRQRVSIARALAAGPKLLLCDEPASALDASNRNYILRLLAGLRDHLGLPIVIISHDLSSLAGIADRVVVLYRGRIVEDGPAAEMFAAPRHPYTALLMASAPRVGKPRVGKPRVGKPRVGKPGAGKPGTGEPGAGEQAVKHDRELSVHQLRRTTADPAPPSAAAACVFAARCPFAIDACAFQPPLEPVADQAADRWSAACHRHEEWQAVAKARPAAMIPP